MQWSKYLNSGENFSASLVETSRAQFLTPAAIKQFICTQQMEQVEEAHCLKLIQDHEPDATYRNKNLMSYEGFVRFLMGQESQVGGAYE